MIKQAILMVTLLTVLPIYGMKRTKESDCLWRLSSVLVAESKSASATPKRRSTKKPQRPLKARDISD
jgi:hypothetical protein